MNECVDPHSGADIKKRNSTVHSSVHARAGSTAPRMLRLHYGRLAVTLLCVVVLVCYLLQLVSHSPRAAMMYKFAEDEPGRAQRAAARHATATGRTASLDTFTLHETGLSLRISCHSSTALTSARERICLRELSPPLSPLITTLNPGMKTCRISVRATQYS